MLLVYDVTILITFLIWLHILTSSKANILNETSVSSSTESWSINSNTNNTQDILQNPHGPIVLIEHYKESCSENRQPLYKVYSAIISLYHDANQNFENPDVYNIIFIDWFLKTCYYKEETLGAQVKNFKAHGLSNNGAIFSYSFCLHDNYYIESDKILPIINFAIIYASITDISMSCGFEGSLGCFKQELEYCQQKILSVNSKLKIIFEIIDDTRASQLFCHSLLPELRKWAIINNSMVLVRSESVKNCSENEGNSKTNWTGVGKNLVTEMAYYRQRLPSNYSTYQGSPTTPNGKIKNNLCPTIPSTSCHASPKIGGNVKHKPPQNVSFSPKHFGVKVYPLLTFEYKHATLLNTIATRFGTILLHFHSTNYFFKTKEHSMLELAAKHNLKGLKSSDGPPTAPLRIFLLTEMDSEIEFFHERDDDDHFKDANYFANKANSIFRGTVPYVLLNAQKLLDDSGRSYMISRVKNIVEQKRNLYSNSTYTLGVAFSLGQCFEIKKLGVIHVLLKVIPFVMFEKEPKERDLREGVVPFYERITQEFIDCINITQSIPAFSTRAAKVGFRTSWPYKDNNGKENVTAVKWMWEQLNDWAVKYNTTVIVDSANDPENSENKGRLHTGWFKKAECNCIASSSSSFFIEREDVAKVGDDNSNRDENTVAYRRVHIADQNVYLNLLPEDVNSTLSLHRTFSNHYFGVNLDIQLFDRAYNKGYREEDVEFLMKLVGTRFSRVMTAAVKDSSDLTDANSKVPIVAAHLNRKLFKKYPQRDPETVQNSITKPISLYVPFNFKVIYGSNEVLKSGFPKAISLADKANRVFNGTVQYLVAEADDPQKEGDTFEVLYFTDSDTDLRSIANTLMSYKHQIQQDDTYSVPQYKLGYKISDSVCSFLIEENDFLEKYVLPHVSLVLIGFSYTYSITDFLSVTQKFENCTKQLEIDHPRIVFGITAEWDDSKSFETNPSALVDFWFRMNEYSMKKEIPVFLNGTFDSLKTNARVGWWKVTRDPDRYNIYEKYQIIYNSTLFGQTVSNRTAEASTTSLMVSVSIAVPLVITGIFAVAIALLRRRYKRTVDRFSNMSEAEVLEFFEGRRNLQSSKEEGENEGSENDCCGATELVMTQAYDTSLEVSRQAFILDEQIRLGSGAYGQVCMGRLHVDGNDVNVAVKIVKAGLAEGEEISSLRSLLAEIKVLSYLGKHENIVALLAAHTENIKKGEVYVFLELCSRGSLLKCLKSLRKMEEDGVDDPYKRLDESDDDTHEDLSKWCLEIASGMEFLAGKHVVHADLATRNVLLDAQNTAKICDFGLSRRMKNYQSYIKSKQEPLPWRWLSPESLRLMEFNEKTDVWSFGVALWEIYSLGDVPYPGMSWSVNFVSLLEDGLRPPIPLRLGRILNDDKDMYLIMKVCWELDPKKRPTFQQLKQMLTA